MPSRRQCGRTGPKYTHDLIISTASGQGKNQLILTNRIKENGFGRRRKGGRRGRGMDGGGGGVVSRACFAQGLHQRLELHRKKLQHRRPAGEPIPAGAMESPRSARNWRRYSSSSSSSSSAAWLARVGSWAGQRCRPRGAVAINATPSCITKRSYNCVAFISVTLTAEGTRPRPPTQPSTHVQGPWAPALHYCSWKTEQAIYRHY